MKATLRRHVLAEGEDVVECGGYRYFRREDVRMDRLKKARKTKSDLECPHGVRFYDVVIEGVRHPRAAWSYEAPKPAMRRVDHRMGFWGEVRVR
jgi:uncharacterized protein (DUF427 family)